MMGRTCEHGLKPTECYVCMSPKSGAPSVASLEVIRLTDGNTQVIAPCINDHDLVIDMLEGALDAMRSGRKIQRS